MIGFIGALKPEIISINNLMKNAETIECGGMEYTKGILNGCKIVTAVCGMGKVFTAMCAQTMIDNFSPELVINTGAAGTLIPELHIGNFAVAVDSVQHDMDNSSLGYKKGEIAEMGKVCFECDERAVKLFLKCADELKMPCRPSHIATGDMFVSDLAVGADIKSKFGSEVVEMEGAAVGQVCAFRKVPYGILRAISDEADNTAPEDFPAFLNKVNEYASALIALFCEKYAKGEY